MTGKMVISIVQLEDMQKVIEALNRAGFGVTQMSSSGGFLRRGNATLMIGVQEEQVDRVLEIIKANTQSRIQKGRRRRGEAYQMAAATVFVVDMDQARIT